MGLGVFEFIILLVIISTVGKVLTERRSRVELQNDQVPQIGPGEIDGLRDAMDDLSGRLVRLEEERDFYKNLLESPRRSELSPSPPSEDPSSGSTT